MQLLREYALSFVGKPYIWGGDDPVRGFDCSGLVQEILASAGVDPAGDQTAQGLFNAFDRTGSWNVYGLGSLAFYGESVLKITHVAFMLDPYRILEAGGGGSKTRTEDEAVAQNAFVRIRPLKHRSDLVAVIKPKYSAIGCP